ncbi:MAG TPA: ABC transporter permease [Conexibacter sp.]|jgi:simple sugar transport system permease protein|nr:ABC transporter permease [Conexibacter sp.]
MTAVLFSAIAAATPLIYAALGGVIAERAGVLSLSLEGYMLVGAFAAVAVSNSHGAVAGLAAAAVAGTAAALVHGFLCITARVNQAIAGLAVNLFALGITGYLNSFVFGAGRTGTQVPAFSEVRIPGLADIPLVGHALFDQSVLTYAAAVVLVGVAFYLRSTPGGLALRAVGEVPAAADARGIAVLRVRYAATAVSGLLGGIGGAALSIAVVDSFVGNMTQGRGYIALAAVALAGWRPVLAVLACVLFGIADATQVWANVVNIDIPIELLATAPYLVTLVVLAAVGRRGRQPLSLGVPYVREER